MDYLDIKSCVLSEDLSKELFDKLKWFDSMVESAQIYDREVYLRLCNKFINDIQPLIYKCDMFEYKIITSEHCKKSYKLNEVRDSMYIIDDVNNINPRVNEYVGYVYAIEWGDKIKIGKTKDPKRRFKELSDMAKYGDVSIGDFSLSIQHSNYSENEKLIHNRFKNSRVNKTELFDVTMDEVLDFADGRILYKNGIGYYDVIGSIYFENDGIEGIIRNSIMQKFDMMNLVKSLTSIY